MECNDLNKKFIEIEGWEKTSDGREAYFKLFKFSDLGKPNAIAQKYNISTEKPLFPTETGVSETSNKEPTAQKYYSLSQYLPFVGSRQS